MNLLNHKILHFFTKDTELSSSEILALLEPGSVSLVTVKRGLTELFNLKFLVRTGKGRSVKYRLSSVGFLTRPFNPEEYLRKGEYERGAMQKFNFDLFNNLANLEGDIFSSIEIESLNSATEKFQKNKREGSVTIHKKELERFVIELSWKSSSIEGNTYSLLDTDLLLREGIKSKKNTESETQMILNHKKAFEFILSHKDYFKDVSVKKIEEVHYLLTHELGIKRNLRKNPVGVTGTAYRPLDNEFQIKEALECLTAVVNKIGNPLQKALFLILGISYIQPFEDGNKRTSRLLGNALLLANDLAPLSYRTADNLGYKVASLIFYEQNSVEAFKKIFIEQYIFACENYNLG